MPDMVKNEFITLHIDIGGSKIPGPDGNIITLPDDATTEIKLPISEALHQQQSQAMQDLLATLPEALSFSHDVDAIIDNPEISQGQKGELVYGLIKVLMNKGLNKASVSILVMQHLQKSINNHQE